MDSLKENQKSPKKSVLVNFGLTLAKFLISQSYYCDVIAHIAPEQGVERL